MVALLCATFLFTPKQVNAKDIYNDWKTTAIVSPQKGELKAGGPIEMSFYGFEIAKYYDIYLDDEKYKTIPSNHEEFITTDIYVTKTAVHSLKVVAVTDKNYEINSNIRYFMVSKKGTSIDDKNVKNVIGDFNESWYYNWGHQPSSHISSHKEYVPMMWNNADIEWLENAKKNYSTVLGFNEPDNTVEANMSPKDAARYQSYFTNSQLRVGSPAVTYSPSNNEWFEEYVKNIDLDDIDFIPVHIYYDWGDLKMAKNFLEEIDKTYAKYGKPIWVTEFALANSDSNKFFGYQDNLDFDVYQKIEEYMSETIKGLEEREYVERYAWFSYGTTDVNGGKCALYDQNSGKLTKLGYTYKRLGNPVVKNDFKFDDLYVEDMESHITDLTLNKSSLVLNKGQSETLIAAITTSNDNDDKTLIWESEDKTIATVDSQGQVKALKPGETTIKATTQNGIIAQCLVYVRSPIQEIKLDHDQLTLEKGSFKQLYTVISPSDTTDNRDLMWQSSNEKIATVDQNGKVKGIANGKATIKVYSENGVWALCEVNVVTSIQKIVLNSTQLELNKGNSYLLKATVDPADTTNPKNLTWKSSNDKIVTVDTNGKIKALKPGTARITVKSTNGITAVCRVIVKSKITSIQLNKKSTTIALGHNETLFATINPSDTTDSKKLVWTSSQTKVAKVNDKGVVTSVGVGSTIITVTTSNGLKAECVVNVNRPILSIHLNKSSLVLYRGKSETLNVTFNPENPSDDKTIIWSSSNNDIVSVNKGVITAKKAGSAIITAKTKNNKTAKCKVVVPYTVTYHLNGGKNTTANPKNYYGKTITLKNATRTGYLFEGWYSDSAFKNKVTGFSSGDKVLYAKWKKVTVSKMGTPTLTNVKNKKVKVSYKSIANVKGYSIQYSTNKNFKNSKSVLTKSNHYTISSLTKGKRYYIRVRAYKLDSNGNKVYGSYKQVKSIKITK